MRAASRRFSAFSLPLRNIRLGLSAHRLYFSILPYGSLFFFLRNDEFSLSGFQLALPNGHISIRFNSGTFLFVNRYDFRKPPHPQRVKCVVFVKDVERRLIQARQRNRLQNKPVLAEVFGQQATSPLYWARES